MKSDVIDAATDKSRELKQAVRGSQLYRQVTKPKRRLLGNSESLSLSRSRIQIPKATYQRCTNLCRQIGYILQGLHNEPSQNRRSTRTWDKLFSSSSC